MNRKAAEAIEIVFEAAAADGRRMLYEFEVYAVLEALGLSVPQFAYVRDVHEVDEKLLARFHGGAVVKVVSPDLAHKSKYGGVKRIASLDPLFVRFVLHNMKEEVLSHFTKEKRPRIDGFLIAETIPFTLALGNEILIGVKEDPAFGPILTLSKGGDDAEFFARYYDPANLLVAPIKPDEALALVRGTKIRHKFEQFGHMDYCDRLAEALHTIGLLASHFAFTSASSPRFHIKSMDVNPFVFSETGRFVAVDGYIDFARADERELSLPLPGNDGLGGFFSPEGIVVAGVSSDSSRYSLARNVVQLLADIGRDDLYCVNPKGGEVEIGGTSLPLYAGLSSVPGHYDLVVYAAPAKNTMAFLDTVPDNKAVILISGIPTEAGYQDFSAEIRRHRSRGLRFIGPNCMGVFLAPEKGRAGINTLFIGEERLSLRYGPYSNTALFTQSGAMGITSIERTQNLPIFKTIVSFGNKVDVDIPDLMGHFAEDPTVRLMAMYIEGMNAQEGRRMFDAACRIRKPIIVYKAGRTEAGAKAAASHTASMSGSYDVFSAACTQAGIILVEELTDFYNDMKVFAMQADFIPAGNRVGGVVNAGLDATMGADTLVFLQPGTLSSETRARLTEINTHGLVDVGTSFLDVTPMTNDRMFADFLDAVLADPGVDCAFVALVPHIENLKTTDDCCREPDAVATLLIEKVRRHGKPVVVSINSGNHYQEMVRYLEENGLPVYSDIRSAIKALDVFVSWHVSKTRCELQP